MIGDQGHVVIYFLSIFSISHGIWNLDFFRYAVPPFCISSKLKIVHIFYLQSISAVYPFILIIFMWISMELYSHNFRIVVSIWRALNKMFLKHIKVSRNKNKTVIDAFATFFLLSYAKIILVILIPFCPIEAYEINVTTHTSNSIYLTALDANVKFFSKHHIPYVTVSVVIFLVVILPPVLLLALYPVYTFRALLFKCCRRMNLINYFVEKFHSCYRDGLDGGRDMRSLASLYFLVAFISYVLWASSSLYLVAVLFLVCSFYNLIFQPYKERYMAITDALILANAAVLAFTLDRLPSNEGDSYFWFYRVIAVMLATFPMLWFVFFITFKVFRSKIITLLKKAKKILKLPCCNYLLNHGHQNDDNEVEFNQQAGNFNNLPDCVLHPQQYMQWGYDSIS